MGMALATWLSLGLLLLVLLLPTQTSGGNRTTLLAANNNSSPTSAPLSTLNNTTTKGHGSSLQSTTGLFVLTISLKKPWLGNFHHSLPSALNHLRWLDLPIPA
uniref:Uncharacterized protein n=1 Tax=Podarcis muralis TaxID=64176 RepID=A0A670HMF1_PODMU